MSVRILLRLATTKRESIKQTVIYSRLRWIDCHALFKSPFVTCLAVNEFSYPHKIDFSNSWLYSFGVTFQSAGQPLGHPSGNYYEQ